MDLSYFPRSRYIYEHLLKFMYAHSLLTARYDAFSFRICLHPDPVDRFPITKMPADYLNYEMLAITRDFQGLLRSRKKGMQMTLEPAMGNFKVTCSQGELINGVVQTGKFQDAHLTLFLSSNEHIYGFPQVNQTLFITDAHFTLPGRDDDSPDQHHQPVIFFIPRFNGLMGILLNDGGPMDVVIHSHQDDPDGAICRFTFPDRRQPLPIDFFVFHGTPDEVFESLSAVLGSPPLSPHPATEIASSPRASEQTFQRTKSFEHLRALFYASLQKGISQQSTAGIHGGEYYRGWVFLLYLMHPFRRKDFYLRRLELSTIMPVFRSEFHEQTPARIPRTPPGSWMKLIRKHIYRRKRLSPYFYTLHYRAHRFGSPILQPLFKDNQLETKTPHIRIGNALLAYPILEAGMEQCQVHLPEGEWIEYESGSRYMGERTLQVNVEPGYYPLYIRAPSIIPVARLSDEHSTSMALEIYIPRSNSRQDITGDVYLDDGQSLDYRDGAGNYRKILCKQSKSGKLTLTIDVELEGFPNPDKKLAIRLPVHYTLARIGKQKYPGEAVKEHTPIPLNEFLLPGKTRKVEFLLSDKH